MSDNRPIGIFDSGIGGLTVLNELHRSFPNESFIYVGDTAHLPYGEQSAEAVRSYAQTICSFLNSQNVKSIVVACNTASAWASEELKRTFDIPIIDVIESSVRAAQGRRIGVLGTRGTILSGAYTSKIKNAEIFPVACPLLVPLIEEGKSESPELESILHEYLSLLPDVDSLILGCTHYPLIEDKIRRALPLDVHIVNSARSCAEFLQESIDLSEHDLPSMHFYVTDKLEHFQRVGSLYTKVPLEPLSLLSYSSILQELTETLV